LARNPSRFPRRLWSPLSDAGTLAERLPGLVPLHAVFDDNRWISAGTYAELVKGSSKFSKFVMKAQQGAPDGCFTVQGAYEQSADMVERWSGGGCEGFFFFFFFFFFFRIS
jgi:hypothetical protein